MLYLVVYCFCYCVCFVLVCYSWWVCISSIYFTISCSLWQREKKISFPSAYEYAHHAVQLNMPLLLQLTFGFVYYYCSSHLSLHIIIADHIWVCIILMLLLTSGHAHIAMLHAICIYMRSSSSKGSSSLPIRLTDLICRVLSGMHIRIYTSGTFTFWYRT